MKNRFIKIKAIRKRSMTIVYVVAILFLLIDVLTYTKKASGVVGDIDVTRAYESFVDTSAGTGGSLPTSVPQYYSVVAYNGSATPTPLVRSAPTKCSIGSGQNSCTITWPQMVGTTTYRVYYGDTVAKVEPGSTTGKYKIVTAPTNSLAHTADDGSAGTGAFAIPSSSLPLSKLSGSGNLWTYARLGIGTSNPTGPVEVKGNIRMDGTNTIKNSALPTANDDFTTKAYADDAAVCPQ